jgi:hypothetical protein
LCDESEPTVIGEPVPATALVTPPLLDTHVAVYFGVVNGLPFACAVESFTKLTRNVREATLLIAGFATCAGAPTTIAGDGDDAAPVPLAFVALTVQVYLRFSVALLTVIGVADEPL